MLKKSGSITNHRLWLIAFLVGSIINAAIFAAMIKLGAQEPSAITLPKPTKLTIGFVQKNTQVEPVKLRPSPINPEPKTTVNKPIKKTRPIERPSSYQQATEKTRIQLPIMQAIRTKPIHKKHSQQKKPRTLPQPVPVYQLTRLAHVSQKKEPEYPEGMIKQGKEATVKLELFIDANGQIRNIKILESAGKDFDRAALNAAHASTFVAANVNGKPVPALMTMPVRFTLH